VAPRYDRRYERGWWHLPWGRTPVELRYAPWRVDCPRCGVLVEQVPWAPSGGRFSEALEELAAYLAQITTKTEVQRLLRISWETVGSIIDRVVQRRLDPERLVGLLRIGIDEFSYKKRHRYLTMVVDHDRQRVVWTGEGRSAETLARFFELLGAEGCKAIALATIDLSAAYIKAVRHALPNAEIVYDRFHVQRLVSDALDQVRRDLVRELGADPDEARAVKRTRFVLLMNPWNLSRAQRRKLSELQRTNQRLYRAYLLKETLAKALDYRQPRRAERLLRAWLDWASRSRLQPFVRAARTIRQHLAGILAYIRTRLSNGLVEGLNGKIRVVTRRAYGFHSHQALSAMIFLTCGGIHIDPPLPTAS
jgi:transposase